MKFAIAGIKGRMGQAISDYINSNENFELVGGTDKSFDRDKTLALLDAADALIDFTNPEYTLELAELCADKNVIHICGTTGFSDEELIKFKGFARKSRIVHASNMSIAVNLLMMLTEKTSSLLDDDFDIEIYEMHHKNKVDAPSGTALSLGQAAADGRGVSLDEVKNDSRTGITGARKKGEIGFTALRGGDVVGDHTVIFAGDGERLELTHKASNRAIYATGSIKAAIWAKDKPNGYYNMCDVLSAAELS